MEGLKEGGDLWTIREDILGNFCQSRAIREGFLKIGYIRAIRKEILRNRNQSIATQEGIGEVGEILLEGDIDFFVIEFRHTNFSTFITGNQFLAIRNDGFAVLGLVNQLYISARRIGKIILDGLLKSPPIPKSSLPAAFQFSADTLYLICNKLSSWLPSGLKPCSPWPNTKV